MTDKIERQDLQKKSRNKEKHWKLPFVEMCHESEVDAGRQSNARILQNKEEIRPGQEQPF